LVSSGRSLKPLSGDDPQDRDLMFTKHALYFVSLRETPELKRQKVRPAGFEPTYPL
jgi:hypothetical protein